MFWSSNSLLFTCFKVFGCWGEKKSTKTIIIWYASSGGIVYQSPDMHVLNHIQRKKKSCFGCIHDVHKVIGNQSIFKVIEQEKKILFTFTQEFGLM